ncbi:MAG: hypothetical protein MIO92_09575 [Methanosarcinaceae archaeon]|nr:hypothetical protein [Methanosarcinaceae archaeon]
MAEIEVEYGDGSSTSNSYCSAATGDVYHEEHRLHVSDWTSATDDEKEISLKWATWIIDDLVEWNGYKYNTTQALEWPRGGVSNKDGTYIETDEIPLWLQFATAELGRYLIANDRTQESKTRGFSWLKAGSLSMQVNKTDRIWTIPDSVWDMIKHYGRKTKAQQRTLERM